MEASKKVPVGLRIAIKNRVVSLTIRDYTELVKRALLVEQDIDDTNRI